MKKIKLSILLKLLLFIGPSALALTACQKCLHQYRAAADHCFRPNNSANAVIGPRGANGFNVLWYSVLVHWTRQSAV